MVYYAENFIHPAEALLRNPSANAPIRVDIRPVLDDARAEVQVQAPLEPLVDELGVRAHLT
jgi:hypothetical protein